MRLTSIVTFTLLVISVVSANDNATQEVIPVPPHNYTKLPLSVKIVGGSTARDHQFPWQASLTSCVPQGAPGVYVCFVCGGSLISSRYVLTAAHCVNGLSLFDIGLGSNLRDKPAVKVTSQEKIVHPDVDIALIKLPYSVSLNNDVQKIEIAKADIGGLDGREALASGYGRMSCKLQSESVL